MSRPHNILAMSAANAVVLLTTIGSYLVYSRLLSAADFGLYAGALAIAKFGSMLLDGGIKVALIQSNDATTSGLYRGAFLASCALALAGTVLLIGVMVIAHVTGALTRDVAGFFTAYSLAYFATYPLLVIPLAQLERAMRFGPVARAEGVSVSIEYGLPALLWVLLAPGFWSFVLSAWLARSLRALMMITIASDRTWLGRGHHPVDWLQIGRLLIAGFHVQIASLASMLRDSLHLVLVGPIFGREWAGLYAWALQMCAAASQVFVQAASRVSLPWLQAANGAEARWRSTLVQVEWLTGLTFPPVAFLIFLSPAANHSLFADKWTAAVSLIPFLVARMLPGIATTALGPLVLASRGAYAYATANIAWTLAEGAAAAALIYAAGATGLAWSYSFMAWLGVALFVSRIRGMSSVPELLRLILWRPSAAMALALTAAFQALPAPYRMDIRIALLYGVGAWLVCISAEPSVRRFVADRLARRGG